MPKTILGYIFKHSARHQIFVLIATLLYLPLLYVTFELPKVILNQAIGGNPADFPKLYAGIALDHQLVALGSDADVEEGFELAEVVVVRAKKRGHPRFRHRHLPHRRSTYSRISLRYKQLTATFKGSIASAANASMTVAARTHKLVRQRS